VQSVGEPEIKKERKIKANPGKWYHNSTIPGT
jgi:hypothetical protein